MTAQWCAQKRLLTQLRVHHGILVANMVKGHHEDVEDNGVSPDNEKTRLNPTYAHTQGVSGVAGSRFLFFSKCSVGLLRGFCFCLRFAFLLSLSRLRSSLLP